MVQPVKRCTRCRKDKNISEFAVYSVLGKQGHRKVCILCLKQMQAQQRSLPESKKRKKEYDKQRIEEIKAKNKEKYIRTGRNLRYYRRYGITLSDYEIMYEQQEGKCYICSSHKLRLSVDHCHSTGKIRRLLCNFCNIGLGAFKDNEEFLKKAIHYLETHKGI